MGLKGHHLCLAGFFCKIFLSAGQLTDQGEESLVVVVVVVLNLDASVLHPSRFSPIFGTILERPRYRIKSGTLHLAKKNRVLLLSNFLDYW